MAFKTPDHFRSNDRPPFRDRTIQAALAFSQIEIADFPLLFRVQPVERDQCASLKGGGTLAVLSADITTSFATASAGANSPQ